MQKGQLALIFAGVGVIAVLAFMGSVPEEAVPEIRYSADSVVPQADFIEESVEVSAATKKVLKAIVGLNAYCTLAYDLAMDFKDTHSMATDTSIVNFVIEYGNPKNAKKNIVTSYSEAMGTTKGKFPDGVGLYLLEHLHKAIEAGTEVTEAATVASTKRVMMSATALGLNGSPDYFKKLSVSQSEFIGAAMKIEAANSDADAQAAAAWLKKGADGAFKTFSEQAAQEEQEREDQYKEEKYEKALDAIKGEFADSHELSSLPAAGGSGASKVPDFEETPPEEIAANAKAKADEFIKNHADEDTVSEAADDAEDDVIADGNAKEAKKQIEDTQKAVEAAAQCTGDVVAYQHNFDGWAASFARGKYTLAQAKKKGFVNDDMSSLKVPKGCVATVWQHGGFTGWHVTFPEGEYSLSEAKKMGFKNDDASSIVVNDAGCESTNEVCDRVAPAEPTCDEAAPSALKCFGTDCFALVTDTKSSFDTAACQCKRLGGSLACFTSQAQEDDVVELWKNTADVDNWDAKMWFGLNDQTTENTWTCGSGAMPFTNWRSGEPNNSGVSGEDCAELSKYGGYKWEDMTCSRELPFVCSVPMPEGYEPAEPKVEEPEQEAAPAFEGKSVTCKLTVDNTLDSVTYNGESLSIDGPKGNWNADKTVTFTTVEDGGKLVVKGHDSESGNSGHCKTAGFAIQCSSSDDFWGSFDSGSSHIKAAGGEDVNGGSFGDWSAPCTTTSGFSLPANRNLKKLWAPNGERWAKFEMGPSV